MSVDSQLGSRLTDRAACLRRQRKQLGQLLLGIFISASHGGVALLALPVERGNIKLDLPALEFENGGERYWRLSDKVVPILPRNAVTYRQAGGSAA